MIRVPRTGRNRRGFTLIDAIAAVVILSIAVPSILFSVRDAYTQRVNPYMLSRARFLAVEKLEEVIADRNSTTRGWSYVVTGNYSAESPVSGAAAFDRSVTISETAADLSSAGTGYKTVAVAISWDDATGVTRTFSVSTVLTDYTP